MKLGDLFPETNPRIVEARKKKAAEREKKARAAYMSDAEREDLANIGAYNADEAYMANRPGNLKTSIKSSDEAYMGEQEEVPEQGEEEEAYMSDAEGTPGTRANRAGNTLGAGLPRGNSDPRAGHASAHERKYSSERGGAFQGKYGTGG